MKLLKPTLAFAGLLLGATLSSCGLFGVKVAELRTDVPEMAVYAAAFNVSQERYRVHVTYDRDLAANLPGLEEKPTLAIGRYLESSRVRGLFQSLDYLFSDLVIRPNAFYASLLDQGDVDGRQVLLPVSFNLPLVVFGSDWEPELEDNFVLALDELAELARGYNKTGSKGVTRMGFGPRWYPEFMYEALSLYGADFREGNPLKWNAAHVDDGLAALRSWSEESNGSPEAEDDFQFKYLYLPPHRSVQDGRIGFAAMDSASFFVIPEERRSGLGFRWLAKDRTVPIGDDVVFAGILRRSEGKSAAEAFLKWFFSEDTQKSILDDARRYRAMESSFGLAGGFSAIASVNERLFPQFYPSLLGRLPPADYLRSPNALPAYWPKLKDEVLIPLVHRATGANPPEDFHAELETAVADWLKRSGHL
ncbi:MAG: hypothetical protein KBB32_01150 [Spirochaetia bacterium]|nr:hypothetical protein [Spirochaetia bacterium]